MVAFKEACENEEAWGLLMLLTVTDVAAPVSSNPLHPDTDTTDRISERDILMDGSQEPPQSTFPEAVKNTFIFI